MSRVALLRLAVVVGFVAVGELLCRLGVITPLTMIPPSAMLLSLVHLMADGEVNADLVFTLTNIAAAITVSIASGCILGVIIHALPRLSRWLEPLLRG